MDGNFNSRGRKPPWSPKRHCQRNESGPSGSAHSTFDLRNKLSQPVKYGNFHAPIADPFTSDEEEAEQHQPNMSPTQSIPSLFTTFDKLNLNSRSKNQRSRAKSHNWRDRANYQRNKPQTDEHNKRQNHQHLGDRGRPRQTNREFKEIASKPQNFEPRKHPLSFNKLQDWSSQVNPEDLLLKLIENSDAFALLLAKIDLSPDAIVLVVSTLSKLSNTYMNQQKLKLIHIVIKELFVDKLITFVSQLPLQTDKEKHRAKFFWSNPDEFFVNLKSFCEMVISMLPTKAVNLLPKLVKAVRFYVNPSFLPSVSNSITTEFESMEKALDAMLQDHETKQKKENVVIDNEQPPPESFREVSLFPHPFEITSKVDPFLRKNIVSGAYRDIEHYLDVQFRLVRNDFVKPLRDGICSYLDPSHKQRVHNIKVYKGVTFVKAEMTNNASKGYLIQLPKRDNKPFLRNVENSRIFMYGSLVLFTKDNFKTILFARIVERKLELLQNGKLVVSLHSDANLIDFSADYLMIESKVYFEPYYYVLSSLQQISERDFPMRNFIIYVQEDTALPSYYNESFATTNLTGNILSHRDMIYKIPVTNGVLMDHGWSSMDQLKLNEAQYQAYKRALTSKFAIIQGPPGTGKTYLGLKVARALLHNHQFWYKNQHPMLVICFTNHALDQFLEGLLSTTKQIVRIGGQSKNKTLEEYNIRRLRSKGHFHIMQKHRLAFQEVVNKLKSLNDRLETTRSFCGIVNITPLLRRLPELQDTNFSAITIQEFTDWLLGGANSRNVKKSLDYSLKELPNYSDDAAEIETEENDVFEEIFNIDEGNRVEEDAFDDIELDISLTTSFFMITLSEYKEQMENIEKEVKVLRKNEDTKPINPVEWEKLEMQYNTINSHYNYLETALEQGKKITDPQLPPNFHPRLLRNPNYILTEERWQLYFYWLKLYRRELLVEIPKVEEEFQRVNGEYEDVKQLVDLEMIRGKAVVGMTTTAAARLQSLLRGLRSRVVIVEEAAEIMEAHIITALTEHCEQVILIGDHKQLRPSTADYMMETKFKLGISLFERMINNKVQCNTLQIQHRMRPEIARLIVPTIYPELKNDLSVYHFKSVVGMQRNLYFIHHTNQESKESDDSKFNLHEVKYLLLLAQYLIQNGYHSEDITILVAYSAQLFKMFRERKQYPLLANVRICVLDNYQGEESKIILLSLVRNNPEGNVGFLKIENRICVALSRAREGFYIMGNMDMLTNASTIWQEMKSTLQHQLALGESLSLCCTIHHDKITLIKTIEDFEKVSEGGCDEVCRTLLTCGHTCKTQCHVTNRDHTISRCREPCTRVICDREHACPNMCYQECGLCMVLVVHELECGHTGRFPCHDKELKCKVMVTVKLDCEHETNKPCFKPTAQVTCPHPCDTRLESCGHACSMRCHAFNDPDHLEYKCRKICGRFRRNCSIKSEEHQCQKMCHEDCGECEVVVKKHRSCTHVYSLPCSLDVETMQCEKPCKKTLACGHPCKMECSKPCGNCEVKVTKTVPGCGHRMNTSCKTTVTMSNCTGSCTKLLSCGHQCQNRCSDSCTTKCEALVLSSDRLICGHRANIPCWKNLRTAVETDKSLIKYCREPCGKTLECTHTCEGSCGECYQGRVHVPCNSKCGVTLVCGHVCKTPCRETCPPCRENCEFRCVHSKCKKRCGEPCTPCRERCARRCKHQACTKKCGEICDVEPCKIPCDKLLRCGHICIGFCGEQCPKLCKVCNYNELVEEFYLGYEDEEDACFVQLADCGHVIESRGMDIWLESNISEIGIKCCPKCKQTLVNTKRYSEYVKTSLKNIEDVKNKFYGENAKNIVEGKKSIAKLTNIYNKTLLKAVCPIITTMYRTFSSLLQPVAKQRRQMLSKLKVQIITSKIQILENICNIYDSTFKTSISLKDDYKDYIYFLLERLQVESERMTSQEIHDYEVELKRFRRISQLEYVRSRIPQSETAGKLYMDLEERLYSPKPYDVANDLQLKEKINKLLSKFGGLIVTEQELKDIVKAVGVKSGAWYKCPNGHLYAIGECGGAMQLSKCPDCGAAIGGTDHTLTARNAHANIDGSSFAAWSDQANMANYQFDD